MFYTETGDRYGSNTRITGDKDSPHDRRPKLYEKQVVVVNEFNLKYGYYSPDGSEDIRSPIGIDSWNFIPFINGFTNYGDPANTDAYNRALTKMRDKLELGSSMFEDWYERKQSVELISDTTQKLIKLVTALKNPRKGAKYLKQVAKQYGQRPRLDKLSDLPSGWLQYHFAVKPLMNTYDSAFGRLSQNPPILKVRGRAKFTGSAKEFEGRITYDFTGRYEHGCKVTGLNPNLHLLSSYGLTSPLTNAFAVIPFGWAVDYFVNVSDVLSNMEPFFPGLDISDYYTTFSYEGRGWDMRMPWDDQWHFYSGGYDATFNGIKRTPSSSPPRFKLQLNPDPLNLKQATYLMSVLALIMKGKK